MEQIKLMTQATATRLWIANNMKKKIEKSSDNEKEINDARKKAADEALKRKNSNVKPIGFHE